MDRIEPGIVRFLAQALPLPGRGRAGLLCNASTLATDWTPSAEALARAANLRLDRILSPQHGFAVEKQDNMVESRDGVHRSLGIPIRSLYSDRREPRPDDLDDLDLLVVDLQDVGTRVYTFLITALLALRAAARRGLPVVVLDRPNPIGGAIEGPTLRDGFESFVGMIEVPLRHGLTAAEYCLYGAWRLGLIDRREAIRVADAARRGGTTEDWLRVVPMAGWRRSLYYEATGLPWVMPSPNMPSIDTALVYPGQVILEGTNLSEGRGTTRPFELFGAPYLDPVEIRKAIDEEDRKSKGPAAVEGATLREVAFEPTFHKFAGRAVRGFQIHVTDREAYRPVRATLAILRAVRSLYPEAFAWRDPPYEYEHDRVPVDLILGTDSVRAAIDRLDPLSEILRSWERDEAEYRERVAPLLIYGA